MLRTTWRARDDYDVACVDVYSGVAFAWAVAVCLLLRFLGKPYVLALHGGGLPDFVTRWGRLLESLVSHSAGTVAQTGYLAGCVSRQRAKVRLIPNGIDIAAYAYRARQAPEPKLVWLRAFHRIYNPTLAVQVLARLASDFPTVQLVMIGPDKGDGSTDATEQSAEELGVSSRVTFAGAVPKSQVPSWLSRGDVFINTADVDNTPVSVEEAMACGLCIVSTDVGGIPHLVRDGEDALLVPARDAAAMSAAVRRVLSEPGLGERLSRSARAKAETLDWARVLPQWEALLQSAASHHAAGERSACP